jgi:cytochrome P450
MKKATSSDKKDIMHYLLEARDSETGEKLTDKQLQDEAIILIFAGVDSTASTMSLCIYNLLKYPKVYANLLEELDGVKPFDQETGEVKPYLWCRENLPYLEAVIYETLRLTPAFPFGVPRVVPEQGTTVGDYYIPENVTIIFIFCSHFTNLNFRLKYLLVSTLTKEVLNTSQTLVNSNQKDGWTKPTQV